ncbi:trichohyalin [Lingula anatina]|uniref:Trichohyalin n=1 Tax=Lingula anatina TaxID=7574 RepID=A0A1S3K600_LINAN|nr:trichohyalin [Lingula anatina]|eukprot:XP_013418055.1 trichohyalin [Lingula anatina]
MSGTCVSITIDQEQDTWEADNLWIGLAFLLGFIVGAAIAGACAKVCIKSWSKKKQQDAKERQMLLQYDNTFSGAPQEEDDEEEVIEVVTYEVVDPYAQASDKGMTEALVQSNSEAAEVKLGEQDLAAILSMENEMIQQRANSFAYLLQILLNQLVTAGRVAAETVPTLILMVQTDLMQAMEISLQEVKEEEKKLRADPKLADKPEELNQQIDALHPKMLQKMLSYINKEEEKVREELRKLPELKEDDVEAILTKLTEDVTRAEEKFKEEQARQALYLEDRMARRRENAARLLEKKAEKTDDIKTQVESFDATLTNMVENGQLIERQKDELMKEYLENLEKAQTEYQTEVAQNEQKLAERLRKLREEKMNELHKQQAQEKEEFLKKAGNSQKAVPFINAYAEMVEKQHMDREMLAEELDKQEVEEMETEEVNLQERINEKLEKEKENFMERLETKAELSEADVKKVLRLHQQQMEHMNRERAEEKNKANAKLQEKLAQRKQKAEENQQKAAAEQQALEEHQEKMINQVLETQMDLSEEEKDRIMKEHKKNVQTLSSQQQLSRLRQQKQLEQKMSQRKAKLAEMKEKKQNMRADEKQKIQDELDKQIAAEEQRIKEEEQKALDDLKKQRDQELEAALKLQADHLSKTIGRLQVGQARRKAIIEKQDQTIQELEEQLAKKIATGGKASDGVDTILQSHYKNVQQLQEQVSADKKRMEQKLRERLEAKRLKRETEVEEEVDKEVQKELTEIQKRGAGKATAILTQMMIDQKHKQAKAKLEQELQQDLEKQQQQINEELEQELKNQLEEQRKQLLHQIAAASNLSRDEINDLVEMAMSDAGASEKQKSALAKELRLGAKKAKTQLGIEDETR